LPGYHSISSLSQVTNVVYQHLKQSAPARQAGDNSVAAEQNSWLPFSVCISPEPSAIRT